MMVNKGTTYMKPSLSWLNTSDLGSSFVRDHGDMAMFGQEVVVVREIVDDGREGWKHQNEHTIQEICEVANDGRVEPIITGHDSRKTWNTIQYSGSKQHAC